MIKPGPGSTSAIEEREVPLGGLSAALAQVGDEGAAAVLKTLRSPSEWPALEQLYLDGNSFSRELAAEIVATPSVNGRQGLVVEA